jgi:hypothetical protein
MLDDINIYKGTISDISLKKTNGNICGPELCNFIHNFNSMNIQFRNNGSVIIGTPYNNRQYEGVTLNNITFFFDSIIFLLSRTINMYNDKEQSGEIIIFMKDGLMNELFISIPIVLFPDELTNNMEPIFNVQTTSLHNMYNSIYKNKSTYLMKPHVLEINNLIPDINSYYYRRENGSDDITTHFISYDVNNCINMTVDNYEKALDLTPNINGILDLTDNMKSNIFINKFKRRFIVQNKLYYLPPSLEDIDRMKQQEITLKCTSIRVEDYDIKTPYPINNQTPNKIIKKIMFDSIVIFLFMFVILYIILKVSKKK